MWKIREFLYFSLKKEEDTILIKFNYSKIMKQWM